MNQKIPSWSRCSSASAAPIDLEICPGALRWARQSLLLVLYAAAGWFWFGLSGLIPVVVWWRHRCAPRPHRVLFSTRELRFAHLGPLRVYVGLARLRRVEVFRDELPAAQYARLRRELKAAASAGDGLEDVEPI